MSFSECDSTRGLVVRLKRTENPSGFDLAGVLQQLLQLNLEINFSELDPLVERAVETTVYLACNKSAGARSVIVREWRDVLTAGPARNFTITDNGRTLITGVVKKFLIQFDCHGPLPESIITSLKEFRSGVTHSYPSAEFFCDSPF